MAEPADDWLERGRSWVQHAGVMEEFLEPFGVPAMELLGPEPGDHLIDIGCGTGATTLALAERVGDTGQVTGVDLSPPMLARARQEAEGRGVDHVEFLEADAATVQFGDRPADGAYSRFGVMFFPDPVTAFANIASALREEGRLGFVCWAPLDRNPWMSEPGAAAITVLGIPDGPGPDEPGPFSLADPDRIDEVLDGAGFTMVEVTPLEMEAVLPGHGDPLAAATTQLEVGGLRDRYLAADTEARQKAVEAAAEVLAGHRVGDAIVMDAAAWLVTARR